MMPQPGRDRTQSHEPMVITSSLALRKMIPEGRTAQFDTREGPTVLGCGSMSRATSQSSEPSGEHVVRNPSSADL